MFRYVRSRAVWLAVGLVLGGGALSYAGVSAANNSGHSPNPHSTLHSPEAEPSESESPEPSESPEVEATGSESPNPDRPHNHGFYVSLAAQCQSIDDGDVQFTAPADCATDGQSHADYVKSVAQSDAGQKDHQEHEPNEASDGHANKHSHSGS